MARVASKQTMTAVAGVSGVAEGAASAPEPFQNLGDTNDGVWFLAGVPGSGKTNLSLHIVASTLAEKVARKHLKRKEPVPQPHNQVDQPVSVNLREDNTVVFPRILIGVGENLQGNDVARHLTEVCKKLRLNHVQVTRLNTMTRERAHLHRLGLPHKEQFDEDIIDFVMMSETIQQLDQVTNLIKNDKKKSTLHGW